MNDILIKQPHFKWPTVSEMVEQADAASRLTILEVNNIGTNRTGISMPMVPHPDGNKSIIAPNACLTGTQSGVYLLSNGLSQTSQLVPLNIRNIFDEYYNNRSAIYICREREDETRSVEKLMNGRFIRFVCEDQLAKLASNADGIIPCGDSDSYHSLPIVNGTALMEWDVCDDLGNVYAMKVFRFVEAPYGHCIFRFKPSMSGIGELNIVHERQPQIILNMDQLYVIKHP